MDPHLCRTHTEGIDERVALHPSVNAPYTVWLRVCVCSYDLLCYVTRHVRTGAMLYVYALVARNVSNASRCNSSCSATTVSVVKRLGSTTNNTRVNVNRGLSESGTVSSTMLKGNR